MARSLERNASPAGLGCLVLFALPFCVAGVGLTAYVLYGVIQWQRMQGWVEVPATILHAELKVNRGGKGGPTHEALARYRYGFAGRPHLGDRVSINGGGDNIGSFQKEAFAELDRHRRAGAPFRC